MIRAFFWSRKWLWWAYGGGLLLFLLLYAQVRISVLFNELYGKYGDLLQEAIQRGEGGLKEFWGLTLQWFYLALIYIALAAFTNYLARLYAFYWRKALTYDYLPRLKNVPMIEGESQRIQEDTREFADILESLGLQAVRNVLVLIAFLPILWNLSKAVNLGVIRYIIAHAPLSLPNGFACLAIAVLVFGVSKFWKINFPKIWKIDLQKVAIMVFVGFGLIAIHSIMVQALPSLVWIVLYTSIGGTVISWFVGIKLPGLEYNNQKVEAAFRKKLVLGEENRSLHHSPENFFALFKSVQVNYKRLFLHYGYFDLWSNWWDLAVAFLPSILIAPSLFSGLIKLGVLNQVENVFFKVHNGFAFIMNNWTRITKLRSIWKRLHEFEANLDKHQLVDERVQIE